MIKKIIHYCWFGGNEKHPVILKCINSWKKYMPDWEIKEWNESNYNVNKCEYTQYMYENKRWAFLSDYARFDVLSQYGGVYFDTDVELLKPIPDDFFKYHAFTGVESTLRVSPGLVFACEENFPVVKKMIEIYNDPNINKEKPLTVNEIITSLLVKSGYIVNGEFQVIDDLAIFPSEIFCGFDCDIHEPMITDKTIAMHHYLGSWKKRTKLSYILRPLRKLIGPKKYRALLDFKRKLVNHGKK